MVNIPAAQVEALPLAAPLVDLASEPAASLRWNGAVFAMLGLLALGWLLWGSREARPEP